MPETKRLIHRKFIPDDLDRLIEMRVDNDVMKYLGGTKMQNAAALKKRLDFYISCYRTRGLGMHAMLWKDTNEMIGWSGLQPLENSDEIEVSYGMIKDFWGKGIGYETALMWLGSGFTNLGLERIVAVADEKNIGSWKIMEKLGMKYEKKEDHYGMDCVFYSISQKEFIDSQQVISSNG